MPEPARSVRVGRFLWRNWLDEALNTFSACMLRNRLANRDGRSPSHDGWAGRVLATLKSRHRPSRARSILLSIDTNLLLKRLMKTRPYVRLPMVCYSLFKTWKRSLGAVEAAEVVQVYRRHPRWRQIGFPGESRPLHDALWEQARASNFAFRRLYDVRTTLTMVTQGVTEFATVNLKDFQGGFSPGLESSGIRWTPESDGGCQEGDAARDVSARESSGKTRGPSKLW